MECTHYRPVQLPCFAESCGSSSDLSFPIPPTPLRTNTVEDTCARITLVLFRTRRRDECARLKEGVRRRVRKSRQKEAAGAADAGLMQIECSEAEVLKLE